MDGRDSGPADDVAVQGGEDTWGFNSARIIRRKNEENLWTNWQRSFGLKRVSQAGELVGVGEIKRRRLYEVKPYTSGGWREAVPQVGAPGFDAGVQGKVGLEVAKVGLTPSLTAEFAATPTLPRPDRAYLSGKYLVSKLSWSRSSPSRK